MKYKEIMENNNRKSQRVSLSTIRNAKINKKYNSTFKMKENINVFNIKELLESTFNHINNIEKNKKFSVRKITFKIFNGFCRVVFKIGKIIGDSLKFLTSVLVIRFNKL